MWSLWVQRADCTLDIYPSWITCREISSLVAYFLVAYFLSSSALILVSLQTEPFFGNHLLCLLSLRTRRLFYQASLLVVVLWHKACNSSNFQQGVLLFEVKRVQGLSHWEIFFPKATNSVSSTPVRSPTIEFSFCHQLSGFSLRLHRFKGFVPKTAPTSDTGPSPVPPSYCSSCLETQSRSKLFTTLQHHLFENHCPEPQGSDDYIQPDPSAVI